MLFEVNDPYKDTALKLKRDPFAGNIPSFANGRDY